MEPFFAAFFFQANTVKGFEAWDKAGFIANAHRERFQNVIYGPLGLILSKPTDAQDHLLEMRVDPQIIHLTFSAETAWDDVIREAARRTEWITRAISVTTFSRLGLRLYLVWPASTKIAAGHLARACIYGESESRWSGLGVIGNSELTIEAEADTLKLKLSLKAVERAQADPQDPDAVSADWIFRNTRFPEYGVMMDADVYSIRTRSSVDVQSFLRSCRDYITDRIIPLGQQIREELG